MEQTASCSAAIIRFHSPAQALAEIDSLDWLSSQQKKKFSAAML